MATHRGWLRSLGQQPRARRFIGPSVCGCALLLGCATNPDRLPELDRRFYENLETAADRQQFLSLSESERRRFLEREGLWSKWLALPEVEREAVMDGDIRVGFHDFAAFMAWGAPADSQARQASGRMLWEYTFIRCTSGPKAGHFVRENLECDGTSDEILTTVNDGLIVELKYPN